MKKILLFLIRAYQRTLSPDHGPLASLHSFRCRFYPSCSQYTYETIEKHGAIRGSLISLYRVARCNPFTAGGVDPVK